MAISRNSNTLYFKELDKPIIVSDFIILLKEILAEGNSIVNLDFSQVTRIYPNVAIPISSIIDYYRRYANTNFVRIDDNYRVNERSLIQPLLTSENVKLLVESPLNKVWCFENSADIKIIEDSLLSGLRRKREFSPGFLDTLDWSLYEIMDNVLRHSGREYGFIMAQDHYQRRHVAICVGDDGQGIYNSLKDSVHQPATALDALKMSVKEAVTRDKAEGQGNGLYGLHQLVEINKGRLSIISNSALYQLDKGKITTSSDIPSISIENGGTIIDFQLDYDNEVSVEAMIFGGKHHTNYVNYYLENLENDEGGLEYILNDWQDGVGTRPSGKKLRLEILNNYNQSKKRIVIDFSSLRIISSSFADEVLGKLVVELGLFNFNNLIKLKNMNASIQQIVQRSVAQRMAESLISK